MMTLLQWWQLLTFFHLTVANFQPHCTASFPFLFLCVLELDSPPCSWFRSLFLCQVAMSQHLCPFCHFHNLILQPTLGLNQKFVAETLPRSSLLLSFMTDSKEQHVSDLCHFPLLKTGLIWSIKKFNGIIHFLPPDTFTWL